jgi:uncharacterized membrane protein YdbT with pleckstrin-like domain
LLRTLAHTERENEREETQKKEAEALATREREEELQRQQELERLDVTVGTTLCAAAHSPSLGTVLSLVHPFAPLISNTDDGDKLLYEMFDIGRTIQEILSFETRSEERP